MANDIFWMATAIASGGVLSLAILYFRLRRSDAALKSGDKVPLP
jgi:hypothetical protein